MGRPRKTTTKTTPVAATLHAVGLSPALKKPAEAIGKVIHIPGSFWPSGVTAREKSLLFHCPLHAVVFRQVCSHLSHEGNCENTFSLSGGLADPNMKAMFLAKISSIAVNENTFSPSIASLWAAYFKAYSKGGKLDADEELVLMGDDTPMDDEAGVAGPSGA